MTDILFEPITLGSIELGNRIIMAPMTRDRAGPGDVPTNLMVEYYRQRASAGLIVTEGVQPSREGKGYWRTPGITTQEQIDGWSRVTAAVHSEGGRIVMQIMHCGRVVVPANRGYEADIIAPSAIPSPDKVPGPGGVPTDCATPRALLLDELTGLVDEFTTASKHAISAGFEGVELHCASGYLINQFLNSASNQRDDVYGGTIENRIRFPSELITSMAAAVGPGRVGFRISPGNPYNAMDIMAPETTFAPLLRTVDGLGLAYVHVVDMGLEALDTLDMVRSNWSGKIITNNMLKADSAAAIIANGRADAVSFGRAFIANPDLVARIKANAPIAKPDFSKLYIGEDEGYTDYPSL